MIIRISAAKKRDPGNLTEDQKGQENAYKRSYSIVGACSCGTEDPLCIDIEIDAESICDKTKQKNHRNVHRWRIRSPQMKPNYNGTRSGKNTFDHDDLKRIFGGKLSGAVVFNTPADDRPAAQTGILN